MGTTGGQWRSAVFKGTDRVFPLDRFPHENESFVHVGHLLERHLLVSVRRRLAWCFTWISRALWSCFGCWCLVTSFGVVPRTHIVELAVTIGFLMCLSCNTCFFFLRRDDPVAILFPGGFCGIPMHRGGGGFVLSFKHSRLLYRIVCEAAVTSGAPHIPRGLIRCLRPRRLLNAHFEK